MVRWPRQRDRSVGHRSSLSEGLAFGALSFTTLALLGFVSSITIARVYGIDILGENALALAPTVALGFLSTVKEQAALVRELAVLPPRAARVTALSVAVFTFSFGITLVIGALTMIATYAVFAGPIGRPDLFAYAAANAAGFLVVGNTCWNIDVVLSAFRAGRALFWIRVVQAVSYLLLTVAAGLIWGSLWALTLAALGSWVISLAHRSVALRRFIVPRITRSEMRDGFRTLPEMVRFGLRIAPAGVAAGVTQSAGTWVLGVFAPIAAVGAFNRAWMLGERLNDVQNRVVEMLFPALVERRAGGDREGFDRSLIDSLRYSMFGLLMIAAAGGGASAAIMNLFGPGFERASNALTIILLLPALAAAASIQIHALYAVDRTRLTVVLAFVRMAVTLSLTVILVRAMDVTGAALAMFIGQLVSVVVLWPVVTRLMSSPSAALWPYRERVALGLAAVAGFLGSRGIASSLSGPGSIPVALVVGCVVFAAVLVARGANARDRQRLAALLARRREREITRTAASR